MRFSFEPFEIHVDDGIIEGSLVSNPLQGHIKFSNVTADIMSLFEPNYSQKIKGNIYEVEIFPNNTLEWWFVPVKTGVFEDLYCKVIDKKINKSHAEMGMRGKIIIE